MLIRLTRFITMPEIVVLAYPRSGSTWLSRLLGYALNCPIRDFPGEKSYAAEERPDNGYVVHQTHIAGNVTEEMKVINLVRDPRDVAVSMFHYWNLSTLDAAIACVVSDNTPPVYLPPWGIFVNEARERTTLSVRFADLQQDTGETLVEIFRMLKIEVTPARIKESVVALSIPNILGNINPKNYPLPMHAHSIRQGKAGNWRSCFSKEQNERVWSALGITMQAYGYCYE